MKLPAKVTRTAAMAVLKAKKNSPHIFFGIGIVGVVGATVMACKATLRVEDLMDDIQDDIQKVKDDKEAVEDPTVEDEKHYRREMAKAVGGGAVKLVRLYGPAGIVGIASVGCLTGSHIQLTRRNAALTAVVGTLSRSLEEYRARVREKVGQEEESDLWNGRSDVEGVDENGKKVMQKMQTGHGCGPYAKLFDETNRNWQPNAEMNMAFLLAVQKHCNQRLDAHGYLLLNDAYEALGIERTKAGAIMGWIRDPENIYDRVNFGIFETRNAMFVNGLEYSIWLDFNCDAQTVYQAIDD